MKLTAGRPADVARCSCFTRAMVVERLGLGGFPPNHWPAMQLASDHCDGMMPLFTEITDDFN